MALSEEKQRRMAFAIIKAVHECDAGMKQGIVYYRNASGPGEALGLLKRAARLPYRIEARVLALVATYTKPVLNAALAEVSTHTLASLQAELDPLKAYSDTLKDNFRNQGWTDEQIAADIEANRAEIDQDESMPIPVGYVDEF